ncbi:MAG TPA: trehalase family glycosidase, partial [Devosia sp.]|nr:trehalase family glycosidase [Devosia sp.]
HADPSHRPTKEQYDRYLWLVEHFRSLGWDNSKLHDASPFQVVDPGFNAILIRSCQDLAFVAEALGETEIARRNRERATRSLAALESLWSPSHSQYLCLDRISGELVDSASIGGLIPVFAAIPAERAAAIAQVIARQGERLRYIVASHDPTDSRFDAKRYWRGPVWLVCNYMIVDGLLAAGQNEVAERIITSSLELIEQSGFAEYYDPTTGEPCGGGRFTWTAAMVLEFLTYKSRF